MYAQLAAVGGYPAAPSFILLFMYGRKRIMLSNIFAVS